MYMYLSYTYIHILDDDDDVASVGMGWNKEDTLVQLQCAGLSKACPDNGSQRVHCIKMKKKEKYIVQYNVFDI